MTWVKKDDRHHEEATTEALLALGDVAGWANTLDDWAESWVGKNLTDGLVPRHVPARLIGRDPAPAIAALVQVGRWRPVPEGWLLVTYLARNPTREKVLALREDRQRAGREGGRTNADEAQRRDDGTFAPKYLLGSVNGSSNGSDPSNGPSTEPTPSPVSRGPVHPVPDTTSPPPPSPTAERGRRKNGSNPRDIGASPRRAGQAPRDLGESPRQVRAAEKRSTPTLAASVAAEMLKGLGS